MTEIVPSFQKTNADSHQASDHSATRLLISVRSASEAQLVIRVAGMRILNGKSLGIVDVKEPRLGALGAPSADSLVEIVDVVGSSVPKSFALGELLQWTNQTEMEEQHESSGILAPASSMELAELLDSRFGHQLLAEFQFVKIGLSYSKDRDWRADWRNLFSKLPRTTEPVVVSYLDFESCSAPCPRKLIEFAASESNCNTILFDTFSKHKNLFGYQPPKQIESWVEKANSVGLSTVLAGSIDLSCLDQALAMSSKFIGVRGAVCGDTREDEIESGKVETLLNRLAEIEFGDVHIE